MPTLTSGGAQPDQVQVTHLDLDLTIHARWGVVERALQALRDSLPPARFDMAF